MNNSSLGNMEEGELSDNGMDSISDEDLEMSEDEASRPRTDSPCDLQSNFDKVNHQ